MIYKLAPIFLLLATASCCVAQPQSPRIVKMGNGITVILQEDHASPLVAVDIWVKSGPLYETAANNGISHFIEHLAFTSTAKYGPGEMDDEMESLGATLDARTSTDWTRFGVTVMSRYLPQALSVLSEAIAKPRFKDADIEAERRVILEEISRKQTQPFKICKDYLAAALYGDHPYSRSVEGPPETAAKLTRDDIVGYYQKRYVPDNIAIVLVGDIAPEDAVSEVGKAFQGLNGKASKDPDAPAPSLLPTQVTKGYHGPYKLGYVAVGFVGPAGADYKDVCAVDLLLTALGSGYRSWMSEELHTKLGMIDQGQADFLTERCPGLISIIASAAEDKSDLAKSAILARITTIRKDGISPDALAVAQRSLLGQYAFQNETNSGRAQSYGFYYAVSDPQFASAYVSCIQSVTNEDIIRVAQKYLDPTHAAIVLVGPRQGVAK
jgi:zinc protease